MIGLEIKKSVSETNLLKQSTMENLLEQSMIFQIGPTVDDVRQIYKGLNGEHAVKTLLRTLNDNRILNKNDHLQ